MQFGVLGPLRVWNEDRPIDLGSPKQRAVLAALIVSANRVVPLDRLIDDLWDGHPPPAATASLQAYVANLRRVLEPDRAPHTPPTILRTRAPGYRLEVPDGALDVHRFESLLAAARTEVARGCHYAAKRLLDEALSLWRGPALEDVAGYGFAAAEIARLDAAQVAAREVAAEAELSLGRHAEAVGSLEALVAAQPWRERPRELLMLALYRSGRQAEALALMDRTRTAFAEELGVDPGPALQELHAAILRHDPGLVWRRTGLRAMPPVEPPAAARPSRSLLVGRDRQLAILRTALDAARSGAGRLLLLAGDPGIGKTRLMREAAAHAPDVGVEAIWGRCHDGGSVPAFWPWVQAVRELAGWRGAEAVRHAADSGGLLLAPLLPELLGAPAVPDPAVVAMARLPLYDAALRMLAELASAGPLLLLLEDVHWADEPSLELLAYVAVHLVDLPMLVVASYREEAAVHGPLADLLGTVSREAVTERIRLTGLATPDVAAIVRERTGAAVDAATATAVRERTEGNPFFVTELSRLLTAEGRLGDPASWPVPETVRDVLRRRVARLPEDAVAVLTAGAVVGRTFDFDVLTRVTGLDEDRVLDAVEVAVMSGLLHEHAESVGRYRFAHALVRETLYDGLSGMRRARLHARVGEALARRRPRDVDALAHHFWHAGPTVAVDRTLEHVLDAAAAAGRVRGFERAIEHLHRALVLIDRLEPGPDRDERELTVQLALANRLVQMKGYAAPEAAARYVRVAELARAAGRTAPLTRALWGLWAGRVASADFPGALVVADELRGLADDTGDPVTRLAAHDTTGVVSWHLGRFEAADAEFAAGIALAEALADPPPFVSHSVVSLQGFRSVTRHHLGDDDTARTLRSAALDLAWRLDQPYIRAFALYHAARLAVHQRDLEATLRFASDGLVLAGEHGFGLFAGASTVFAAWADALHGRPGAERIAAAQGSLERAGTRMLRTFFLGLRAEAELAEGRSEQACRTLEQAFTAVDETGERFYVRDLERLQRQAALSVPSGGPPASGGARPRPA